MNRAPLLALVLAITSSLVSGCRCVREDEPSGSDTSITAHYAAHANPLSDAREDIKRSRYRLYGLNSLGLEIPVNWDGQDVIDKCEIHYIEGVADDYATSSALYQPAVDYATVYNIAMISFLKDRETYEELRSQLDLNVSRGMYKFYSLKSGAVPGLFTHAEHYDRYGARPFSDRSGKYATQHAENCYVTIYNILLVRKLGKEKGVTTDYRRPNNQ